MARKIQLGALILAMLLVGVERFTAQAASTAESKTALVSEGFPIPPPD